MFRSWLLFLAVLVCAVLNAAFAQVYSVNAVGYVNVTLKPGYNLVGNPLFATDNSVGAIYRNIQGGVPPGLTVIRLVNGQFVSVTWDEFDEKFVPESDAAAEILPGDGVFVFLPGIETRVLTFVGQVLQGEVCTPIPRGFSLKSSPIPQRITLGNPIANFPVGQGDIAYFFNATLQQYRGFQFDDLDNSWAPFDPVLEVGEAFLFYRAGPPTNWCRTFFVNNPS